MYVSGGRRGGKIGIQLDGLNSIEHCVCVPGDTWCRSAGGDVLLASTRMIYCRVHGYANVYTRISRSSRLTPRPCSPVVPGVRAI